MVTIQRDTLPHLPAAVLWQAGRTQRILCEAYARILRIIAGIEVHKTLDYGLLESIYEETISVGEKNKIDGIRRISN